MQELFLYMEIYAVPVLLGVALSVSGVEIYKKTKLLSALALTVFSLAYLSLMIFSGFMQVRADPAVDGNMLFSIDILKLASELAGVFLVAAAISLLIYAYNLRRV